MNIVKSLAFTSLLCISSLSYAQNTLINAFYYDFSDEFINTLSHEIDSKAKDGGYNIKNYNATASLSLQSEQIDSAFANNNKNFLLNLVDPVYATNVVDSIKDDTTKLLFINRMPKKEVLTSYKNAYFIGAKAKSSGIIQASIVHDYYEKNPTLDKNHDGILNIVFLKGEINHEDTVCRTKAFLEGLDSFNIKYKVIFEDYANWSFNQGYEAFNRAVDKNGLDNIELIVANNDAMALGALAWLNENDYNTLLNDNFIAVVGIDAIKDAIDAINSGKMIGSVCNDAKTMAKIAIDLFSMPNIDLTKLSKDYNVTIDGKVIEVPYKKVVKQDK